MIEQKKILVVEDEVALRTALKEKFTREGFLVLEAGDGVAAIQTAQENKPDLILLDIIMPKQNGLDVLTDLKKIPSLVAVPVFVTTNLSEPSDMEKAKSLGAEEYLVKSDHSLDEILAKVKERLEK